MHKLRTSVMLVTLALMASGVHAAVILPPKAVDWQYTFTDPTGDLTWNTTTVLAPPWAVGPAPFGNTADADFGFGTVWAADGSDGDDLWVRHAVDLTGYDLSSIVWNLGVDNGYKLYANGTLVSGANAEGFTFRWEYAGGFAGTLVSGVNVIAVALEDHGGATAFDMQILGNPNTSVPEPISLSLLGLGLIEVARRKRRANRL